MNENPYESPKEVSSPPTVKAGMAIGVLLLMAIPAGCICGGVTCFGVGTAGDVVAGGQYPNVNAWLLAIPIGLIVVVMIPVLAVRLLGRQNT